VGRIGSLALAFGLALGLASVLIPVMRLLARRAGLVAVPREDRWHRGAIPLLGGPAIVLAIVITFAVVGTLPRPFWPLILTAFAMAAVGFLDDLRPLRPPAKFVAQLILATVLFGFGFQLRLTQIPLIDMALTLFWIVGITNAFNLLDNMDGLAAGIAVIAAGFRLLFFTMDRDWAGAVVAAIFMGAVLAFLIRNFPPASIFMGDAGSLFLGFFLSGLFLSGQFPYTRGAAAVLLFPVLLVLVPIFDTAFVTVTRLLAGRPVSAGGRDHPSHRLVAIGISERKAVLLLYGLSIASGSLAYVSYRVGVAYTIVFLAFLGLSVLALGIYLSRVNVVASGQVPEGRTALRLLVDFPYKRHVATVAVDLLLIILAYYSAYLLRFESRFPLYARQFFDSLPVVIVVQLAALAAFGAYRGIWRYTGLQDLLRLAQAVTAGTAGVVLYIVFAYRFEGYSRAVFILDWLLLLVFIGATRLSFRLLAELLRPRPGGFRRVLIYGAGDGGELTMREILNNPALGRIPVGFLDDDTSKTRTQIHGVPVLGGLDRAGELVRKHEVSEVIVSSSKIPDGRLKQLSEICEVLGIPVVRASLRLE